MKDRVTFPGELWTDAQYFFVAPTAYDESVVKSKWTQEAVMIIRDFKEALQDVDRLSADTAKSTLQGVLDKHGVKIGKVMQALRLAVTGEGGGPDLMQIMEILGVRETTTRIENALKQIQ